MSVPVSVILTCHESPWLRDALTSVIGQTVTDWELLVLDDLADSTTRHTVEDIADPRVRYLPNKVRLGPALNHQRGFSEARFDLISIINHDDMWEPELLDELTGAILQHNCTNSDAVAAFSDHWIIREDGQIDVAATERCSTAFGRTRLVGGPHYGADLYRVALVHRAMAIAQCAVVQKRLLPPIPRWVGGAYDFYIATKLVGPDRTAVYVPKRLARFREHGENLGLQRSPVRDLATAAVYLLASRGAPPDIARHCRSKALNALASSPSSVMRVIQQALIPITQPRLY